MLNSLIGIIASSGVAAGGDYESIATTTLSSNAGTVTFSSIPTTYQHLQLRITHAGYLPSTSGVDFLYLSSVNGNAPSYSHRLSGDGSAASAGADGSNIVIGNVYTSPTPTQWSATIIDILDYSNTNKNKTFRSLSGNDRNGSGVISLMSAVYSSNTNAITSFILSGGGSFIASGSTFALYGIKG